MGNAWACINPQQPCEQHWWSLGPPHWPKSSLEETFRTYHSPSKAVSSLPSLDAVPKHLLLNGKRLQLLQLATSVKNKALKAPNTWERACPVPLCSPTPVIPLKVITETAFITLMEKGQFLLQPLMWQASEQPQAFSSSSSGNRIWENYPHLTYLFFCFIPSLTRTPQETCTALGSPATSAIWFSMSCLRHIRLRPWRGLSWMLGCWNITVAILNKRLLWLSC